MKPICGSQGFAGSSGCILDHDHSGTHIYGDTNIETLKRERNYVKELEQQLSDAMEQHERDVATLESWNAAITDLQKQLANAVQMLSDQDFEYNRKTNDLIERHAQQLAAKGAALARATGMPYATEGARAVALEKKLVEAQKQITMLRDMLLTCRSMVGHPDNIAIIDRIYAATEPK